MPEPHSRLTVEPGHLLGQAGQQQRHARDVAVVLAGLVGAAEDHVVDRRPVDRRDCAPSAPSAGSRRDRRRRTEDSAPPKRPIGVRMKSQMKASAMSVRLSTLAVPSCAALVRACRSRSVFSSSSVGAGVVSSLSANATFQPQFFCTSSRVTPGCSETTVNSLVSGSGCQTREVGDQQRRALGVDAEPLAMVAAVAMAERGVEVDLLDHAAQRLLHGDVDLARRGRDLRRAAAARQPRLRLAVVADHRGVDVAEFVELGRAQKADR